MAYRYTNTNKWSDAWYSDLKPLEKLLFNYLCDNCDIAGFIEFVPKKWAFDIGCTKDAIQGTGGASFVTAESAGLYQSDECFKMALTDAISVACKALGFGADVYYQKDRTKYDQEEGNKAQTTTPKPIEPPKREIPTLSEALGEVAIATTEQKVAEIWAKYPQFKKEESFIKAVKEKGE